MREDWVAKYPESHIALVRALLRACEYCDDYRNREEILNLLVKPEYVGSSPEYTSPGFLTPYNYGRDSEPVSLSRFNQFFVDQSNYPRQSEALWILTQLARWGYTPFPKNWVEVIERVRRTDLFNEACREMELPNIEPNRGNITLFDGMVFNHDDPVGYLQRFNICRKFQFQEIPLASPNLTK